MTKPESITVSEAARLKGTSRQAVRDAVRAEKISIVSSSGYMMLLDRASVENWEPSSRAGTRIGKFRKRQRVNRIHGGFVPISQKKLPDSLPTGRWFEISENVWVGLILPENYGAAELAKGADEVVCTEEFIVIRYTTKNRKKNPRSS